MTVEANNKSAHMTITAPPSAWRSLATTLANVWSAGE